MDIFWIILGAGYLLSLVVQNRLRAAYNKWGSIRNSAQITGADTARVILRANNVDSVSVAPTPGKLSDHYDPRNKSVRLSEAVYDVPSVAAMAVAAHEVGHAMQDEDGYWLLRFRSAMAPLANAAARYGIPATLVGFFFGSPLLMQLGVLGYIGALLFQFMTLPVEFDASRRALAELDRLKLLTATQKEGARSMLRAAAMTYVAGAATSAAYVVYLGVMAARWIFRKPLPTPPPYLP